VLATAALSNPNNPVSNQAELDRALGAGYAAALLLGVIIQCATTDWAAERLACAIKRVACGLALPEEEAPASSAILRSLHMPPR
jgi:hypothetical protein